MSAISLPPKHNSKEEHYETFFQTLNNKFIVGGDYNAKHPRWGLHLTTSKGRELVKAMDAHNLNQIYQQAIQHIGTLIARTPNTVDLCDM